MPIAGTSSEENPNVCPACTRLIAELAEEISLNEVIKPEASAKETVDFVVPETVSLYGTTLVWQEKI